MTYALVDLYMMDCLREKDISAVFLRQNKTAINLNMIYDDDLISHSKD